MNQDQFNLASACLFTVVSLLHLTRIINDWDFILGSYGIPMELSLIGLLLTGILSVNGFRLLFKK